MRAGVAAASLVALVLAGPAQAEDPKLPLAHDEHSERTVYIQPRLSPTEDSMHTQGATVGVQAKDGRSAYMGTDRSTAQPRYSVGAESGGDLSFSAGVESDGKEHHGVKAGIRIRY
ncbi:hypothetical protein PGB34_00665 [Xenophilus arseniciresistens]|uniref:Uncharacterized protein n=1 Tax=Xenophilus arseniciresistens TaxID=1283306 RepID=A0AAE3SZ30_9BURK|nr:hypothetical protein [Xenophilus arseniciresistens]MDA7414862.1 hypothetical protein [Xenophilus arseniciresistens]